MKSTLRSTNNQSYIMSSQAFLNLIKNQPQEDLSKNVNWTDDIKIQLPIRTTKTGLGSLKPTTLIDWFRLNIKKYGHLPALSKKISNKWNTIIYQQYYDLCCNFGKSLIALGFKQYTALNIIGFNAPEWHISFFGSLFAKCLPIGVYTTNNQTTCQYLVKHSNARIIIAENMQYCKRYLQLLRDGLLDYIVIYNDSNITVDSDFHGKIMQWNDFMNLGKKIEQNILQKRMDSIKPGNCCTIVYTSGTTGMPKGVMISHDNYTWTKSALDAHNQRIDKRHRIVSFLPLSHLAAQFSDITSPIIQGIHVYFAEPTALQGTLIDTLLEVRPTLFFSVPRIWEKIYERMMQISKSNGWLAKKVADWAKSQGIQGCINQLKGEPTTWKYKISKSLIYNQIKKRLGLDQCDFFLYGAAPLNPEIRRYFAKIGIFLINSYGMSQTTGPQNFSHSSQSLSELDWIEVGKAIPGTAIKIDKTSETDQDGNHQSYKGQMCFRGRNIFMGYYKDSKETQKSLSKDGYLKSGDVGKLSSSGVLRITGRAKQLIITAGGQNIPPILIENQILAALPFLSNVMVIGDNRKYLTCLVSLQQDPPKSNKLKKSAKQYLSLKGCQIQDISQCRKDNKVKQIIAQGLKKANQKAISRAQHVQTFFIMPQQFSIQNGLLTPTLKLKRNEVVKKYHSQIEQMYMNSKL